MLLPQTHQYDFMVYHITSHRSMHYRGLFVVQVYGKEQAAFLIDASEGVQTTLYSGNQRVRQYI